MSVNNSLYATGIIQYGSEDQKQRFLPPGRLWGKGGCLCADRTDVGFGCQHHADQGGAIDGGTYRINGRKSWVSSGPAARYIVLFAMTNPEQMHRGISAFLIDTDRPGFSCGKKEPKLGIRASATSEIVLEDYLASEDERLGQEGEGFKIAMAVLDAGRIGIAAQALGIAEAAYEASLAYSVEREAFGQKIGQFQGIGFKLADMKTRIEASRLLIYSAALASERCKKTGERFTLEASMAKLYASETASFTADQAVQIHGGMGYSRELPIERYFRDARITEIYEGTSEIQRLVIARLITGLK